MKCKHCGEPITGGKGDYFHFDEFGKEGRARCADGVGSADPVTLISGGPIDTETANKIGRPLTPEPKITLTLFDATAVIAALRDATCIVPVYHPDRGGIQYALDRMVALRDAALEPVHSVTSVPVEKMDGGVVGHRFVCSCGREGYGWHKTTEKAIAAGQEHIK